MRAGYTIIEVLISTALIAVVLLSSYSLLAREQSSSRSVLEISHVELSSQEMLFGLEQELANAVGSSPIANATVAVTPTDATLAVQSNLGFPPFGMVIVDRGQMNEERLSYAGIEGDKMTFTGIEHGQSCTSAFQHAATAEVIWSGLAEPLAQQSPAPDPSAYDGLVREDYGDVYYRGDGTGFSYRVPLDPIQKLAQGEPLSWGAEIAGFGEVATGWNALYFQPRTVYEEADGGHDVNGDGDVADLFDVGQIRKVRWNVKTPTEVDDLGLGPASVLQERCNHGGDLDGDGFDDPLFLWNRETSELHVRLFLIGSTKKGAPVTRKVESVMFLRNTAEL